MKYQLLRDIITEYYRPREDHNNFLEIGCKDGSESGFMFKLINDFSWITKLVGVDDDRDGFMKEFCPGGGIQKYSEQFKEYEPWRRLDSISLNKITIKPMSVETYTNQPDFRFDFVILSDILHFYKTKKQRLKFLDELKKLLDNEGMIYIKVASTNHHYHTEKSERAIGLNYESISDEVEKAGYQFQMKPEEREEGHWYYIISQ